VAVLMGMITAVFGGVLRDIVCNEIPTAFRDRRPYAVCAFVGGWCVVAAGRLDWPEWLALVVGGAVAFALRAVALVFDWRLRDWRAE